MLQHVQEETSSTLKLTPSSRQAQATPQERAMPPEELLAELHTLRTVSHQQAVMTPPRNKRSVSWWLLLTGCVLSTAITICVCFWFYHLSVRYQNLSYDYSDLQSNYSELQAKYYIVKEDYKDIYRALHNRESPPPKAQDSLHK